MPDEHHITSRVKHEVVMPIFEYACPACGFVNEALVNSAAAKAPACPKCGHQKTVKKMSSFSAVVKAGNDASPTKCRTCPNAGGCPGFEG